MAPRRAARAWACLAQSVLLWNLASADGPSVPIAYCASVNTSPNPPNFDNYQSDGLCSGHCGADWALAVVQGKSCWCTNYIPDESSQVPIENCNAACPGYPSDLCGGKDLFGYMALQMAPSGTAGGGPPPASVPPPSTQTPLTTVTETVQSTPSEAGTSTSRSSSSDLDTTTSFTPTPSVLTVTAGGTVQTVTVTPSAKPTDPASNMSVSSTSGGGLATGAAVGIAVGAIAAAVAIGVFLWVWCVRRRKLEGEPADGPFVSRSPRGSSAGMTASPGTGADMSENRFASASEGRSLADNWDPASGQQGAKRRSTLMPVDPRLDPFARGIYNTQNKSHESFSSFQDNQDYSRRVHEPAKVLRAVNPDPDP